MDYTWTSIIVHYENITLIEQLQQSDKYSAIVATSTHKVIGMFTNSSLSYPNRTVTSQISYKLCCDN